MEVMVIYMLPAMGMVGADVRSNDTVAVANAVGAVDRQQCQEGGPSGIGSQGSSAGAIQQAGAMQHDARDACLGIACLDIQIHGCFAGRTRAACVFSILDFQ